MTEKPHYDFGQMGFEAFHNGIKEPEDDPAFTMGLLANEEGQFYAINPRDDWGQFYAINPRDDWNEGWWLARLQEADDERN
jgi:hypothetical protein